MSVNVDSDFGELGVRIEPNIHFTVVLSRDALSRALFDLRNTHVLLLETIVQPLPEMLCRQGPAIEFVNLGKPFAHGCIYWILTAIRHSYMCFKLPLRIHFGHIVHCRYRAVFLRLDFCSDIEPVEALYKT